MIPDSVVMAAGWLFIWSLGIGFVLLLVMIAYEKAANRIDRLWAKKERTAKLKAIVRNINEELESRGDK